MIFKNAYPEAIRLAWEQVCDEALGPQDDRALPQYVDRWFMDRLIRTIAEVEILQEWQKTPSSLFLEPYVVLDVASAMQTIFKRELPVTLPNWMNLAAVPVIYRNLHKELALGFLTGRAITPGVGNHAFDAVSLKDSTAIQVVDAMHMTNWVVHFEALRCICNPFVSIPSLPKKVLVEEIMTRAGFQRSHNGVDFKPYAYCAVVTAYRQGIVSTMY